MVVAVRKNNFFRRVLSTRGRRQVVAMALRPGENIGAEKHKHVTQTFTCVTGTGVVRTGGYCFDFDPGDVVNIPKGQTHDVVNVGKTLLRFVTVYVPPNHLPGRVHKTKADALADVEDEAFGKSV